MYNQKKNIGAPTSCSESAVCANARAYLTQNMHSIQDFVCVIRPRCDFNQKKDKRRKEKDKIKLQQGENMAHHSAVGWAKGL